MKTTLYASPVHVTKWSGDLNTVASHVLAAAGELAELFVRRRTQCPALEALGALGATEVATAVATAVEIAVSELPAFLTEGAREPSILELVGRFKAARPKKDNLGRLVVWALVCHIGLALRRQQLTSSPDRGRVTYGKAAVVWNSAVMPKGHLECVAQRDFRGAPVFCILAWDEVDREWRFTVRRFHIDAKQGLVLGGTNGLTFWKAMERLPVADRKSAVRQPFFHLGDPLFDTALEAAEQLLAAGELEFAVLNRDSEAKKVAWGQLRLVEPLQWPTIRVRLPMGDMLPLAEFMEQPVSDLLAALRIVQSVHFGFGNLPTEMFRHEYRFRSVTPLAGRPGVFLDNGTELILSQDEANRKIYLRPQPVVVDVQALHLARHNRPAAGYSVFVAPRRRRD